MLYFLDNLNNNNLIHCPENLIRESLLSSQLPHVYLKETLNRGRYVLIPATNEPGKEDEFYLRVFSGSNPRVERLKKDEPRDPWFRCGPCSVRPYSVLTRVRVVGASGLQNRERFGSKERKNSDV